MTKTKSLTHQELATLYGVHRRTLARWMKEEGIIIKRRLLRPKDLQLIYAKLGKPDYEAKKSKNMAFLSKNAPKSTNIPFFYLYFVKNIIGFIFYSPR